MSHAAPLAPPFKVRLGATSFPLRQSSPLTASSSRCPRRPSVELASSVALRNQTTKVPVLKDGSLSTLPAFLLSTKIRAQILLKQSSVKLSLLSHCFSVDFSLPSVSVLPYAVDLSFWHHHEVSDPVMTSYWPLFLRVKTSYWPLFPRDRPAQFVAQVQVVLPIPSFDNTTFGWWMHAFKCRRGTSSET